MTKLIEELTKIDKKEQPHKISFEKGKSVEKMEKPKKMSWKYSYDWNTCDVLRNLNRQSFP